MNLQETHIMCEALEHFIACSDSTADPEMVKIARQLLSRYVDEACTKLAADYRARLH